MLDAPEPESTEVGDLSDKTGADLIDHYLLYGATVDELEALSGEQWATLEAGGMAKSERVD